MRFPCLLPSLVLCLHVQGQCHYDVDTIDKFTGERILATKAVLSLTRSNATFTFEQQKGHGALQLDLCQDYGAAISSARVANGDTLLFDTKEGSVPLNITECMGWELQEDSSYCTRIKCPIELDKVSSLANQGVERFRVITRTTPWVFSIKDKATWPAAIQESARCFLKGAGLEK